MPKRGILQTEAIVFERTDLTALFASLLTQGLPSQMSTLFQGLPALQVLFQQTRFQLKCLGGGY
jgi:hypothetical protein